jgi:hypothetical protein
VRNPRIAAGAIRNRAASLLQSEQLLTASGGLAASITVERPARLASPRRGWRNGAPGLDYERAVRQAGSSRTACLRKRVGGRKTAAGESEPPPVARGHSGSPKRETRRPITASGPPPEVLLRPTPCRAQAVPNRARHGTAASLSCGRRVGGCSAASNPLEGSERAGPLHYCADDHARQGRIYEVQPGAERQAAPRIDPSTRLPQSRMYWSVRTAAASGDVDAAPTHSAAAFVGGRGASEPAVPAARLTGLRQQLDRSAAPHHFVLFGPLPLATVDARKAAGLAQGGRKTSPRRS